MMKKKILVVFSMLLVLLSGCSESKSHEEIDIPRTEDNLKLETAYWGDLEEFYMNLNNIKEEDFPLKEDIYANFEKDLNKKVLVMDYGEFIIYKDVDNNVLKFKLLGDKAKDDFLHSMTSKINIPYAIKTDADEVIIYLNNSEVIEEVKYMLDVTSKEKLAYSYSKLIEDISGMTPKIIEDFLIDVGVMVDVYEIGGLTIYTDVETGKIESFEIHLSDGKDLSDFIKERLEAPCTIEFDRGYNSVVIKSHTYLRIGKYY